MPHPSPRKHQSPQQGKPPLCWAGLACFRALRLKRAGLCRQHKQKGRIGIMLIAPLLGPGDTAARPHLSAKAMASKG